MAEPITTPRNATLFEGDENPYMAVARKRYAGPSESDLSLYMAAARRSLEAQESRTRVVLADALKGDPNAAADRLRLSQTTGLPTSVVTRNFDELRAREEIRAMDLLAVARRSPTLMRQLSDPTFASAVSKDIDVLSRIEGAMGRGLAYAMGAKTDGGLPGAVAGAVQSAPRILPYLMGADGKGGLPGHLGYGAQAAVDVGLGATAGVGEFAMNTAGAAYSLLGMDNAAKGLRTLATRSEEARKAVGLQPEAVTGEARSEERRVGKECW